MNDNQIKLAISQAYPTKMTYVAAKKIVKQHGRHRERLARRVGYSEDRVISVELVGSKKKLRYVEFMIGLHDPLKASVALKTAVHTIRAVNPNWSDEEWLVEQVKGLHAGRRGKIKTNFLELPLDGEPLPVYFIKVHP